MPEVPTAAGPVTAERTRHKSHRFVGPQQAQRLGEPSLLPEAVKLSGRFEGNRLVVQLSNLSGHAFPTGFPGRLGVLELKAFDAAGKEVFRNVTTKPMEEHPEAVFNKGFVDAEGKPALAAFAVKEVRDSRLAPGEVREVSRDVPASAVRAEVRLKLVLAGPLVVKTLAYDGPETKPLMFAPVVFSR